MILVEGSKPLFFQSTAEACAMVETLVNQGTDQNNIKDYTDAIKEYLSTKFEIPTSRIYVTVNAVDNWF